MKNRVVLFALLCVLVGYGVLVYLSFDPRLDSGGDSAGYLLLGEALAQGKGFVDLYKPGMPPHNHFPPGYPLILAIGIKLGIRSIVGLKVVSALFSVGVIVLVFLLLRGWGDWLALGVCAMLGTTPFYLEYTSKILSEAPFLFFFLLSVYLSAREEKWAFWGALLFCVFSFYIRSAGLALIPGLALSYFLRGKKRESVVFLLVGVFLCVPWMIRNSVVGGVRTSYVEELLMKNPYDPSAGSISLFGFVKRIFVNLWTYLVLFFPASVVTPLINIAAQGGGGRLVVALIGLCLLGFWVWGIWRTERGFKHPLYWGSLLLFCSLLVWPEVWRSYRFFLPILPVMFLGILLGVRTLWKDGVLVVVGVIVLVSIVGMWGSIEGMARVRGAYFRFGDKFAGYHPAIKNYLVMSEWAGKNLPQDALFVCRKPELFSVFARRKAIIYPFTSDREEMWKFIRDKGVDYILVDGWMSTTQKYLLPALQEHSDSLEVVGGLKEPLTLMVRVIK